MAVTHERGFTLIELIIVVALIALLAALGTPFLMAAKGAANEASAIASLKAINSAQSAFSSTCGSGYFATTVGHLIDLEYLNADLALDPKSGFSLEMEDGSGAVGGSTDCGGEETTSAYYVAAVPLDGSAGRRGFATNQGAVIWQDEEGGAPAEPFTPSDTVGPIQ
jgi:prepilin-type N-terminal cleavage/methylation domain-containing protein